MWLQKKEIKNKWFSWKSPSKYVFTEIVSEVVSKVRISDYRLSRSWKWASVITKCAVMCLLPNFYVDLVDVYIGFIGIW